MGALDEMTFRKYGDDLSSGTMQENEILFQGGTFQSVDCQEFCNFGWSVYRAKTIDAVIHFTAIAVCPDAPQTVVWYSTITGDGVAIDVTWTTGRWYWINQIPIRTTGA